MMTFMVEITEEALLMLEEIHDRRVRGKLLERIRKLAEDPLHQGKPMMEEITGLRSALAVGQRYRFIYEIQATVVKVLVVGVGLRKEGHRVDVDARMAKLFRKK